MTFDDDHCGDHETNLANEEAIRELLWDHGFGLIPVVHEHTDGTVIRLLTDETGAVMASFPDVPGMAAMFTALTDAPRLLTWLYGQNIRSQNQWAALMHERDDLGADNARLRTSINQCPHDHSDLDHDIPTEQETHT
ncbi:hypothetical protein LO763_22210 [Glycomyces sp. A-F 0318]|uniref:hypothetical protein n=1 Tax=Glycomyces amatae TaxID=2881355 RepID=UPI001E5E30DA|nr:hypothetical protein [Glycomyces amatae]MCD0446332.1 hypothetical protein [Glycomyces amatae]